MDEYVLTKGKYFLAEKLNFGDAKTKVDVNVFFK